ncbi:MAG: AMP-binding protein [Minwuiales bacterium]|nr:AMP-binding protein [Minwuiales bacterium]
MTDIARFFSYPAWKHPDRTALIDDHGEITFAELTVRAGRFGAALKESGAKPGDRVAIILPNGIPFIVAECAILQSGLVKVPLNIRFHAEEVLYALADCAPTVLVCDRSYAEAVKARRGDVPGLNRIYVVGDPPSGCASFDDTVSAGDDDPGPPHAYGDDDPVLIRYTGGTTGRPKGIVHTARSYHSIVLDVVRENALTDRDVALQLGHLSHGLNFMWPAYYAVGATQVLREAFDPPAVWRDFVEHRITWVYMVPTMIHMLLEADDGGADVSSLRTFCYASAPMPVPLLRRAIARLGNIFNQVYTLSEAPVITTMLHADEHREIETSAGPRLASIGREVLTMELKLIDNDGAEVAPGEVGEIAVRSVNNMAYYWNLPEETAKTLVDGWVRTGDMARRDEDGFLYLADRKKDIVITGGFNVYPKEVEDVLLGHPAVAQAAVVGAPDEKWGEIVTAFVVLHPDGAASAEDLAVLCREHLADYKKPRRIEFVDDLPLTPVGKISRRALRERAAARGA